MSYSHVILLIILFSTNHALPTNKIDFDTKTAIAVNQKLGTEQLRKQYADYVLYKQQYNKPDEDNADLEYRRFTTYMENIEKIREHNKRYERGEETYEMGINQFTDMLPEELSKLNGFRNEMIDSLETENVVTIAIHKKLPKEIDWRKLGAVTKVKDQKGCGSCWAFSAVGALEGQHFMKTGTMIPLSEQNLIDCSSNSKYGNMGCYGGYMKAAFDYVKDNDGIATETSYPYEAKQDTCRYLNATRGASCIGSKILPFGDEIQLQAAVAEYGPISVAVDSLGLELYRGGIFAPWWCSWQPNHAVLAVGYGTGDMILDNGTIKRTDYWIIKNSWGKRWGEDGYFRLARNLNNTCGVASYVVLPMAPSPEHV